MSFLSNPIANISGGIHDLGKGIANATKNPLVDMAAAAALDYFTGGAAGMLGEAGAMGSITGLGAAGNAALLTGGIAGLASGNLAQGFMAGVAGWGGASAGESLGMGGYGSAPVTAPGTPVAGTPVGSTVAETVKAGTGAGTLATNNVAEYINAPGGLDEEWVNSVAPAAPATATPMPEAPASPYSVTPSAPTAPLGSGEGLKLAANTPLGTSGLTAGAPISTSGLGSLAKDPSLWTQFKALPWYAQAGIGAAGVAGLKAMAKPQPLNVPKQANTQFIRNYNYNPFGGYSGQGVVPAATGGLVALADGGAVQHFDDGGPAFSNQQISDYVSNIQAQGGGDKEIAAAMDQFHVDPGQLAGALGMNVGDVQSRYNAAEPTGGYYTGTIDKSTAPNTQDPSSQFIDWYSQNYRNVGTPQLSQELNTLGIDPSKAQGIYDAYAAAGGWGFDPDRNLSKSVAGVQAQRALGSNANNDQLTALSNALVGNTSNTDPNYAQLSNLGITPEQFAQASGANTDVVKSNFNQALNPQLKSDSLASSAGVPVGVDYTYGRNLYGQDVIQYTDPSTGQQMMYAPSPDRATNNSNGTTTQLYQVMPLPKNAATRTKLYGAKTYTYGLNPTKANINKATGGLMALANGGRIKRYAGETDGSVVTSDAPAPDAALAAYQAGDYAGASKALADAGMSAQDVVSKYGLSAADAANVAKNLGYTGDLSGLNYGTQPPSTNVPNTSNVAQTANAPIDAQQNFLNTMQQLAPTNSFAQMLSNASTNPSMANQMDSTNRIQSDIGGWINDHPNASTSDISSAVDAYSKSQGINSSDIYSNLGLMAAKNPNQYETTLQNFNTAQNIDPTKAFQDYLKKNTTLGYANQLQLPDQSDILKELNTIGLDPTKANDVYNNLYGPNSGAYYHTAAGDTTMSSLANINKVANLLNPSDRYALLNGQGDETTQKQFNALSQALNNPDKIGAAGLAQAGVTPEMYSKLTGQKPDMVNNWFDYQLNPQGQADIYASQLNLPKGASYQIGTNGFGQQGVVFTDPTTKQQMLYTPGVYTTDPSTGKKVFTASSNSGSYGLVPLSSIQSNDTFMPTFGKQTYTYGTNNYVSPFNAKGQIDTTNSAAIESAYKLGLLDTNSYLKAKQGLTKKAAGGGLMALANGGAVQGYADGGFTNQQISDYVANIQAQGGGDKEIAAAMDKYGVGANQLASALGANVADVQSRYNAADPTGGYATGASGISNQQINNWLGQNPTASDASIYNAMQQYKVDPTQMANATGLPLTGEGNTITDRYNLAQDIIKQGDTLGQAPANNPFANDTQWAQFMDAHKNAQGTIDPITVQEMARTTGLSVNEVLSRYNAAEALLHPAKKDTNTNTGNATAPVPGTSNVTQTVLPTNSGTNAPAGTANPYGNVNNPGDITRNADGTITVQPTIPGRPYGGYSGLTELTNAYTAGGGHTGYVSPTVANLADFNTKYNTQTGGSQAAYDYLMGKSPYPTVPSTPTGEISKPYNTSVMGMPANPAYTVSQPLIFDAATRSYKPNPNFDPHFSATRDYLQSGQVGISPKTAQMLGYKDLGNGIYGFPNSDGTFTGTDGKKYDATGKLLSVDGPVAQLADQVAAANGGLMGLAGGGVGTLGSYSDGGRLLRGPGDGISDSIPATIGSGNPQPARLADGEFVVPARIVSELGNGSTEAGARKLYQMMDRVQNARKKTTGKKQVAANPNAQQYLPA